MLLLENISHDELKKYMKEFYDYALGRLKIDRAPKIVFIRDQKNADDMFGKTGFYDPDKEKIALFVTDRHAKDVLRSFAHELIHHEQKCKGLNDTLDLSKTATDPAYASHDEGLRAMEKQAFRKGNMLFRDWCDTKKLERSQLMSESKKINEADVPKSKEKEYRHQTGLEIKKLKGKKGISDKGAYAGKIAKMKMGIAGQEELEEEAKPDFLDLDGDGNKKEPMKKAAKDAKKKKQDMSKVKEEARSAAKKVHAAQRGTEMKEDDSYTSPEAKENLSEKQTTHPHPQLLQKGDRLFKERFNTYEEAIFQELLKRAIK